MTARTRPRGELLANCYQKLSAPAQRLERQARANNSNSPWKVRPWLKFTVALYPQALNSQPHHVREDYPRCSRARFFAWNFMAATTSRERITRIAAKLGALLAAADTLKAKAGVQ